MIQHFDSSVIVDTSKSVDKYRQQSRIDVLDLARRVNLPASEVSQDVFCKKKALQTFDTFANRDFHVTGGPIVVVVNRWVYIRPSARVNDCDVIIATKKVLVNISEPVVPNLVLYINKLISG